ncbi:hypothetical protein ES703_109725 [subsurface metagenome]
MAPSTGVVLYPAANSIGPANLNRTCGYLYVTNKVRNLLAFPDGIDLIFSRPGSIARRDTTKLGRFCGQGDTPFHRGKGAAALWVTERACLKRKCIDWKIRSTGCCYVRPARDIGVVCGSVKLPTAGCNIIFHNLDHAREVFGRGPLIKQALACLS